MQKNGQGQLRGEFIKYNDMNERSYIFIIFLALLRK